ncbi:ATP-binding protein [Streptomyces sp. NPDC059175]|uniref:ATP-binding protein n=1 Tax=Streptomyces sp. NPDC059175 TaxID=3346757 RepID=UPI00369ECD61
MRRSNLLAKQDRFVGRDNELSALGRLLARSRLVTVTGADGMGKTRLALRAAAVWEKRYCDGVRTADLSTVHDPGLLVHALTTALGVDDRTGRPPRTVLLEHLAERQLLLVLDGFDPIAAPCARLVRDMMRRAPGLHVLATGRRPLGTAGESVLPLPPLAFDDAVLLLTDRAAAAAPGFRLGGANGDAVRELCRRLDGVPLALELAAGRLPGGLSPDGLLRRLGAQPGGTTTGPAHARTAGSTLRATVGWSHASCSPEEQLLWARLSVFAGHVDPDAVEYVCTGPELPPERIPELLDELLAQSVVCREETPAGVRYRMPEPLRAYGAERLAALGDASRLRRRHRDWYMGLATWWELDWFGPRQAEVAVDADAALPDLRAALELCMETPQETHLAQYLAGTLWFYWVGCGRLAEGRHWLERAVALEGSGSGNPRHDGTRLKTLWVLGYVALLQGDGAAAVRALEECDARATATGDPGAEASAAHRRGCLALLQDDPRSAEGLLRRALAAYREQGELTCHVLMAQVALAMSLVLQGDAEAASGLCEDVREVCAEHGEQWTRAYALYVQAYACWVGGSHGTAGDLLAGCIAASHRLGNPAGLAPAIELLALVTVRGGDAAEAAVLLGAAVPVREAVGLRGFGSGCFSAPVEQCEQRAIRALGAAAYAALRDEGRQLTLDAAVERALAACAASTRA